MNERKAATIRDVSVLSGVSLGTVSRYINGKKLKANTAERVRKAIEVLGYRENINARMLKTGRSKTIGILVEGVSPDFEMPIIKAFEKVVSIEGYSVMISFFDDSQELCLDRMLAQQQRKNEGVLCIPAMFGNATREIIKKYTKLGIAFVVLNQYIEDCKADILVVDNADSSRKAVEYLILQGYDDIGIINGVEWDYVSNERYRGYVEALTLYQKKIPEAHVYGYYSVEGGYKAGISLLSRKNPPSAVYIINNKMTLGFVRAAMELGFSIPDDVAAISYDKNEMFGFAKSHIPYVEQPLEEMGRQAAELMLRRISGDDSDFPLVKQLKARLIT